MKERKIGFIGLGTMGFSICYGLYKKGFHMILPTYRKERDQSGHFTPLAPNENTKRALYDEMLDNGCEGAESPAKLFQSSEFIIISVPTSRQVEEVMCGEEGILNNARQGAVIIDLTSADAMSTRKLAAQCEERGLSFLDAPVSGGQEGAAKQTLSVMVGGNPEVFEKARVILETIGDPKKVTYVGPSGAGDALKCINNYLSSTNFLATTEALTVAAKSGIDPKIAVKVIAGSGGRSHATEYKMPALIFTGQGMNMSVDLMMKDIGLYNGLAQQAKVPDLYGNLSYQLFNLRSSEGRGGEDFSTVMRQYEDWTGVKLFDLDHLDAGHA